jgi:3-deoxy-7-phosphoheptulonate synthase
MIDCSHANAMKDPVRQMKVLRSAVRQRREGQEAIIGVMIESNLGEGTQPIPDDRTKLAWGVSITDPCLGWDHTEESLRWAHEQLSRLRDA